MSKERVEYLCGRCGYKTRHKSHYDKHQNRKYICKEGHDNGITTLHHSEVIPESSLSHPEVIPESSHHQCSKCNMIYNTKLGLCFHVGKCNGTHPLQCSKCNHIFSSKQAKYRHMKKVDCSNKQIVLSADQQQHQQLATTTNNTVNNTNSNNNTINNNGNIINNNITINGFGQENIEHLRDFTSKTVQQLMNNCIKQGATGVCTLLNKIHFDNEHPENQNIRKLEKKNELIEYFDGNDWQKNISNYILEDIFRSLEKHFSHYVDHYVRRLDIHKKTALDKFMRQVCEPLEWDFTSDDYDYKERLTEDTKKRDREKIYSLAIDYIYHNSIKLTRK